MNHHLQLVFAQCTTTTEVRSVLLAAIDGLVMTHLQFGTTCTQFRDDYQDACELAEARITVIMDAAERVTQRWEAAQLARLERLESEGVHAAPLTTNEESLADAGQIQSEINS